MHQPPDQLMAYVTAQVRRGHRVRSVIATANVIIAALACLSYALTWFVDEPCSICAPRPTYTATGWEVVSALTWGDLYVWHVRLLFGLALATLAAGALGLRRPPFYVMELVASGLVLPVGCSLELGLIIASGSTATSYAIGAGLQFACSIACLIMAGVLSSRLSRGQKAHALSLWHEAAQQIERGARLPLQAEYEWAITQVLMFLRRYGRVDDLVRGYYASRATDAAEAACRATGRLLSVGVVEDAAHWQRVRELQSQVAYPPYAPYGVPQWDLYAGMAIASLVLGVASDALLVFTVFNVPIGAIGLALGILGLRSTSRHRVAIAGVILCAIGLALAISLLIVGLIVGIVGLTQGY